MDINQHIESSVRDAAQHYLQQLGQEEALPPVTIEIPKNKEYGDFAAPVAMLLARTLRKPPMEIAHTIAERIPPDSMIARVNVAAPGFVNFTVTRNALCEILRHISKEKHNYGRCDIGQGKRALVEFVSANPTGPLHIGHARNAVVGDTIARCLEAAGYTVMREYYFNDAGVQMKKLGESLRARYLQQLGIQASLPTDGYQGEYLVEIARHLVGENGDTRKNETDTRFFTDYATKQILRTIDEDMKNLGITFDEWVSESEMHRKGKVRETLDELKARSKAYQHDGAWWLRSSEYGDEKDRVLVKRDGEPTYLAPDLAYHKFKYERRYDTLVNVFGGDHHGYVPRLAAGIEALGYPSSALHCVIIQMVTLLKGGERTKLSTRSGEFITLNSMINELGRDVVRFFFLMRSADSHLVFDWELAKDTSMNNPVYYVQYAHARFCSIFKKAAELGIEYQGSDHADLALLETAEEKDIIMLLAQLPQVIKKSAEAVEPHHLTLYLRELAGAFHQYFTIGTKESEYRVLVPDNPELTQARLALIDCLRTTIANGLSILGVSAPERM
jgi:arginyl-tRNA synthetase